LRFAPHRANARPPHASRNIKLTTAFQKYWQHCKIRSHTNELSYPLFVIGLNLTKTSQIQV
ncbi:MAG: hypothetical protein RML38_09850, partial [Bacteroidia bacterium]|nr:hypothetical protein [Bacteroidia bacterium]